MDDVKGCREARDYRRYHNERTILVDFLRHTDKALYDLREALYDEEGPKRDLDEILQLKWKDADSEFKVVRNGQHFVGLAQLSADVSTLAADATRAAIRAETALMRAKCSMKEAMAPRRSPDGVILAPPLGLTLHRARRT